MARLSNSGDSANAGREAEPFRARPEDSRGKPGLSGLWRLDESVTPGNPMAAIKAQPWAKELANKHQDEFAKDSPALLCLPLCPQVITVRKVVQTPSLIVLLYDTLIYRQVFMDAGSWSKTPILPGWDIPWGIGRETRW
jgi:hypothetical protein